ncbi:uncharacterized protein LAESUDRAFT_211854 [Laetiporus sulphureus 93-53]|uniref:Uncharacterized protein n=1 Tax=Laetiporus sulphureus 93-53 TaxID=1314785 RepID=A0A165DVI7_9APHY|nr:uncharacterized protein LAESUDRAFT_211854 [Laetiporus sulphureus 93-53]KZT05712.1 hypothetical protein LAESUDRAFT_211854 [Laetiporus sulphureus 93-53]
MRLIDSACVEQAIAGDEERYDHRRPGRETLAQRGNVAAKTHDDDNKSAATGRQSGRRRTRPKSHRRGFAAKMGWRSRECGAGRDSRLALDVRRHKIGVGSAPLSTVGGSASVLFGTPMDAALMSPKWQAFNNCASCHPRESDSSSLPAPGSLVNDHKDDRTVAASFAVS